MNTSPCDNKGTWKCMMAMWNLNIYLISICKKEKCCYIMNVCAWSLATFAGQGQDSRKSWPWTNSAYSEWCRSRRSRWSQVWKARKYARLRRRRSQRHAPTRHRRWCLSHSVKAKISLRHFRSTYHNFMTLPLTINENNSTTINTIQEEFGSKPDVARADS